MQYHANRKWEHLFPKISTFSTILQTKSGKGSRLPLFESGCPASGGDAREEDLETNSILFNYGEPRMTSNVLRVCNILNYPPPSSLFRPRSPARRQCITPGLWRRCEQDGRLAGKWSPPSSPYRGRILTAHFTRPAVLLMLAVCSPFLILVFDRRHLSSRSTCCFNNSS